MVHLTKKYFSTQILTVFHIRTMDYGLFYVENNCHVKELVTSYRKMFKLLESDLTPIEVMGFLKINIKLQLYFNHSKAVQVLNKILFPIILFDVPI